MFFCIKSSIVDVRLGSKYASETKHIRKKLNHHLITFTEKVKIKEKDVILPNMSYPWFWFPGLFKQICFGSEIFLKTIGLVNRYLSSFIKKWMKLFTIFKTTYFEEHQKKERKFHISLWLYPCRESAYFFKKNSLRLV